MLAAVDALRVTLPRMGTRKLQERLAAGGLAVGRDALGALLQATGRLVARKPRYTRTTYADHRYTVAPNLLKAMTVTAPGQVVVSDITYLRLTHAFVYLFLVTDLFSRKIVGWHVSRDLSHAAAVIALHRAIATLGEVTGVVHHSDRGSQYCCHAYRQQLAAAHMLSSMTDENHCYQNAVAERINGILKDEFDLDAVFPSVSAAIDTVERTIPIYNGVRTHWSLDLQTPDQVFYHAA